MIQHGRLSPKSTSKPEIASESRCTTRALASIPRFRSRDGDRVYIDPRYADDRRVPMASRKRSGALN
jgi:hypothetical protein